MRTLLLGVAAAALLLAGTTPGLGAVVGFRFTADDIVNAMTAQDGVPLHDADYQWGVWAVRVMPKVTGGGYAFDSSLTQTNQAGWGCDAPSWYSWPTPYADVCAWFWDESGAEVEGNPPNPLYMIMDRPANTFTSYFGNVVTKVAVDSFFDVFFELDPGATWDGTWQFVVDGSKYTYGTEENPGAWVQDYFGGFGNGGGRAHNMGDGYQVVPEPSTILIWTLVGALAMTVGWWRRRRAA